LILLSSVANAQGSKPDTTIYNDAETPAQFPGGISELYKFIGANLQYPDLAKSLNIQGRVLMSFVVEKDGSLSNFTVLRGPLPEVNAEALRVMKLSPKWSPGKQGGEVVRQLYSIPINFTLKDTTKAAPEVFSPVEIAADFPGGVEALYKWLSKNIKYPLSAREANIQGKVTITFVIEKDGSLSNFKIVKGVSYAIDEEALRVMKLSPKWKPGMQNGRPVREQYTMPINFSLADK